jgi:hypothetical protein
MAKKKGMTNVGKKPLTVEQSRKLKIAAIDLFKEAKKLDLKIKALKDAAHVLSVPHKY